MSLVSVYCAIDWYESYDLRLAFYSSKINKFVPISNDISIMARPKKLILHLSSVSKH